MSFFHLDQVDGKGCGWDGMGWGEENASIAYETLVSCSLRKYQEQEQEPGRKGAALRALLAY